MSHDDDQKEKSKNRTNWSKSFHFAYSHQPSNLFSSHHQKFCLYIYLNQFIAHANGMNVIRYNRNTRWSPTQRKRKHFCWVFDFRTMSFFGFRETAVISPVRSMITVNCRAFVIFHKLKWRNDCTKVGENISVEWDSSGWRDRCIQNANEFFSMCFFERRKLKIFITNQCSCFFWCWSSSNT